MSIMFDFRFNFVAYVIFSSVNTIVYCIPAGWLWSKRGFLYQMGVIDIAGSCGVHLCGGASGEFSTNDDSQG
jgi:Amt family ammonium transporter